MELENQTPFHAHIFRGVIGENRFCASVVVRITYDIKDGKLEVSGDQTWKISPAPYECQYGKMRSDELFYRGGVDIFILGSAYLPEGALENKTEVNITLGEKFKASITVLGHRVWKEKKGELVPSIPTPFTSIPLNIKYAFGGADEFDQLPIPFPDNPLGKGYFLNEENALGHQLPNIENPDDLISQWDDRPDPVGISLCPDGFGPRLRESLDYDKKTGELKTLHPTFFNAAFPKMVAISAKEDELFSIQGVTRDGKKLSFKLPASGLMVALGFGDKTAEHNPRIDQIGVEVEQSKVFISYRYPFRYNLVPQQKRFCKLSWNKGV